MLRKSRITLGSRRGVSEIVGALMLILIVVVVAGSIAVFVSALQQNEMERRSHLESVTNEKLEIVSVALFPDDVDIEFVFSNNTGDYYVQYIDETRVFLHKYILLGDGSVDDTKEECELVNGKAYSSHVVANAKATQSGGPCTIDIDGVGSEVFHLAPWQLVSMSVRNLNIDDSAVWRVSINDVYANEWLDERNIGGLVSYNSYNFTTTGLIVPAQETRKVVIDFTSDANSAIAAPLKSDQLDVDILSPAGNFFSMTDLAPSPIVEVKTQREDYSITSRDVIVLDGSGTQFPEGKFVKQYIWRIDIPQNDWTDGDWSDTGNIMTKYLSGKIVEYRPESMFTSDELLPGGFPPDADDPRIEGPLRITLKVVDENGLVSRSETVIIAENQNIDPVGSISLLNVESPDIDMDITIQVRDIFGRPTNSTGVSFSNLGGKISTISPSFIIPDGDGKATTTATWNGAQTTGELATIGAAVGRLPVFSIPITAP